jgi:hypothetical protein
MEAFVCPNLLQKVLIIDFTRQRIPAAAQHRLRVDVQVRLSA